MCVMLCIGRKCSNTGNSALDDEESVLKTPSIAASLSMKDSNFISMSIKADEKSTNKNYETILTPTMRTIHSKEQSSSEILTLGKPDIDESQTISTLNNVRTIKPKRKPRKTVMSSHPGIDELDIDEEKGDMNDMEHLKRMNNKRKKRRKRNNKHDLQKALILPISKHMTENIKQCYKRRDNLLMDESEESSSCSSSDDEDENNHHRNGGVEDVNNADNSSIDESESNDNETNNDNHNENDRNNMNIDTNKKNTSSKHSE